jgi:hypothetical protein
VEKKESSRRNHCKTNRKKKPKVNQENRTVEKEYEKFFTHCCQSDAVAVGDCQCLVVPKHGRACTK